MFFFKYRCSESRNYLPVKTDYISAQDMYTTGSGLHNKTCDKLLQLVNIIRLLDQ